MQNLNSIKNLPKSERPYEKFISMGASAMSDAELLSIIIKSGTTKISSLDISKSLLKNNHGNLLNLYDYSLDDLMQFPGIGEVKAIQLKAIAELSRRISQTSRSSRLQFNNPSSIADYFMEKMRHEMQEKFIIAYFDAKNNFLGDALISIGKADCTFISIKDIFKRAFDKNALKLVALHNHPSGDPTPSESDIYITKRLKESAKILDLFLMDHIIIGDNTYYSFTENNKI